jgi:hypothetical protein
MAAEHVDQDFAPDVIDAMVDLYRQTEGMFRVLYNGPQAGATIPWHLHYQITTERFPVEDLAHESAYPTVLWRVDAGEAAATAGAWIEPDPEHRRVNVLVAGDIDHPTVYVFARDRRQARADSKGLMGGFEICGDLIFSEPDTRSIFETASFETARQAITEVRPEGV